MSASPVVRASYQALVVATLSWHPSMTYDITPPGHPFNRPLPASPWPMHRGINRIHPIVHGKLCKLYELMCKIDMCVNVRMYSVLKGCSGLGPESIVLFARYMFIE